MSLSMEMQDLIVSFAVSEIRLSFFLSMLELRESLF